MTEQVGRDVTINIGGAIATGRTKSFSINNETIDVTSDGDAAIQRLLAKPGQKSVEASISGMFDNTELTLLDLALNGTDIEQKVTFGFTAFSVEGDFVITSFEISGEYNDAVTFSASFSSSGAFAKTA